jgi:hypothetical protein
VQELGITSTSVDPVVATLFGIECRRYGEGVVYLALRRRFRRLIVPPNVLGTLEREIAIAISPLHIANLADFTITALSARKILINLGFALIPAAISDYNHLQLALETRAPISEAQIREFTHRAIRVGR